VSQGTTIAYEGQPYTGSIVDKDSISSRLAWIGQENPYPEAKYRHWHGRYLQGLDGLEGLGSMNVNEGDASFQHDDLLNSMEEDDDVYGSGIFDRPGRADTIHSTLGVFADHPSLPGYIGRERQFAVNPDLHDVANGADVVAVPGGGMAYVERGGRQVDISGRPNPFNVYENLNRPHGIPGPCPGCEPLPPRVVMEQREGIPAVVPGGTIPVPARPEDVSSKSTALPAIPAWGVKGLGYFRGYGADAPPAPPTQASVGSPIGSYVAAGAIVGVAAAIFIGTLKQKHPKRGRR
jgi:hypothetical protein